jgi:hypothetical protein
MDSENRRGNQCKEGSKSTVKIIMIVKALADAVSRSALIYVWKGELHLETWS